MSALRAHLRSRLAGVSARWAREWDALMGDEELQGALRGLGRQGGDPGFALFVLTHFRWRRVQLLPVLRDRERLLRAIHLVLEGKGLWSDRLREGCGGDWKTVEETLQKGATYLKAFHHTDESVFESTGTRYEDETPRFRSHYASTCLLVLDWHLRQATGSHRSNRRLLARLIGAFGMMKRSDPDVSADPERWIEKRLERASKEDEEQHSPREFVEKFVAPSLVHFFHSVHESCHVGCGSACRPFEGTFRAEQQEQIIYQAHEAQALMREGERAEARKLFRQVLESAEQLLGSRHVVLVPILRGYAAAERGAGDRASAIAAAKRMAAILVGERRKLDDLVGFTHGSDGTLQPVWRGSTLEMRSPGLTLFPP